MGFIYEHPVVPQATATEEHFRKIQLRHQRKRLLESFMRFCVVRENMTPPTAGEWTEAETAVEEFLDTLEREGK